MPVTGNYYKSLPKNRCNFKILQEQQVILHDLL
jgi:hypothetical protein